MFQFLIKLTIFTILEQGNICMKLATKFMHETMLLHVKHDCYMY